MRRSSHGARAVLDRTPIDHFAWSGFQDSRRRRQSTDRPDLDPRERWSPSGAPPVPSMIPRGEPVFVEW